MNRKIVIPILIIAIIFISGCSSIIDMIPIGKAFRIKADANYNGETCEVKYSVKNGANKHYCINEITGSIITEEGMEISPTQQSFGDGGSDYCFYPNEKKEGTLIFSMNKQQKFTLYIKVVHSDYKKEELFEKTITSSLIFG